MGRRSPSGLVVALGMVVGALAIECTAAFEAGKATDAGIDQATTPASADDAMADVLAPYADSDSGSPSDPNWAQWPMPNSPVDVGTGAPNAQTYTDNGDGTVTDHVTGLIWQQTPVVSADDPATFPTFRWTAEAGVPVASTFCTGLTLAGQSDWRLPTLIELISIVDSTVANPSINEAYFPGTPSIVFWSATPAASSEGDGWGASFDYGYTGYGDGSSQGAVRCVRGGLR